MKNSNCKTGRTTRMLQTAIDEAVLGRAVYVVASDNRHKKDLAGHLDRMLKDRAFSSNASGLGIKFETVESLSNLDLATVRLQGAHPNCRVLVDHYTIEKRFSAMLAEYHRYDIPSAA